MPEGGGMPYDAAAFASKASPLFQADWADAEPLKFVLRDLDSICERALWRTRGHAPASEVHMLHKMCRCGAQVLSCTAESILVHCHVLCGVRQQG